MTCNEDDDAVDEDKVPNSIPNSESNPNPLFHFQLLYQLHSHSLIACSQTKKNDRRIVVRKHLSFKIIDAPFRVVIHSPYSRSVLVEDPRAEVLISFILMQVPAHSSN